MPKIDGVGYGDFTEKKLEHFSKILEMHFAITKAVISKNANIFKPYYHYVELTSGKGFTPIGKPGSPIIFFETAHKNFNDINFFADFIDCDKKNIRELIKSIDDLSQERGWGQNNCNFHCNKYQEVIPSLFAEKSTEFGLIFVDHSGDLPDISTIQFIADQRPKMEVLLYLSSTNIKRTVQYTGLRFINFINSIGKTHWLVRKPINHDRHKWTFILGSNAKNLFTDYKSIGFYQIESKVGKSILERINFTEREQFEAKQPRLI